MILDIVRCYSEVCKNGSVVFGKCMIWLRRGGVARLIFKSTELEPNMLVSRKDEGNLDNHKN